MFVFVIFDVEKLNLNLRIYIYIFQSFIDLYLSEKEDIFKRSEFNFFIYS